MAATAKQIREATDDVFLARMLGGAIQQYTLRSGRNIRRDPIPDILAAQKHYQSLENEDDGSALTRLTFEPIPLETSVLGRLT